MATHTALGKSNESLNKARSHESRKKTGLVVGGDSVVGKVLVYSHEEVSLGLRYPGEQLGVVAH